MAKYGENICIRSGRRFVQLYNGNLEWAVDGFMEAVGSQHALQNTFITHTIEKNGQLPMMQYKIHLDKTNSRQYVSGCYLNCCYYYLKCTLANDIVAFPEGGIFCTVESDVLKEDGSVYSTSRGLVGPLDNDVKSHHPHCFWKVIEYTERQSPVHSDGSLKFRVKIEISMKEYFNQIQTNRKPSFDQVVGLQSKTISDFVKQLKTIDPTDVKVICKDGKEFLVSRAVLRARSEVFDVMFRANMTESNNHVIQMEDFSSDAIGVMLQFIEKGTVAASLLDDQNRTAHLVEEVILAADKYQLMSLIDYFNERLGDYVCDRNALALLRLSNNLNLKDANEKVKRYIQTHPSSLDYAKF